MIKLFRTLYKRARLFLTLLYCKTFRKRKPVLLYLLVTDRCQMRCSYCFVDHVDVRPEMSTKQLLDLIDEAYSMGTRMICLMGGEPLLREDIDVIIDHIQGKGMICDMTTNGLLIKEKLGVVKKVDALMVSLDGDEKANDLNRGKGTYKKIVEGIKVARENGVITRINTVLTKNNIDSIEHILGLAKEYGMYVTFAITAEASGGSEQIKDMLLSDDEIRGVYKKIKKLKLEGNPILLSPQTVDYIIDYPLPFSELIYKDDEKHRNYYPHECMFGRLMGYVDADGKVYPCAGLWQNYTAKSVLDGGLKAAWENMADLKCHTCWCAGGPEWDRISSLSGIIDGLKLTLNQVFSTRGKKN
jgi:MoaA/NifB/PqqE/SkfB family radical SAM enzyme